MFRWFWLALLRSGLSRDGSLLLLAQHTFHSAHLGESERRASYQAPESWQVTAYPLAVKVSSETSLLVFKSRLGQVKNRPFIQPSLEILVSTVMSLNYQTRHWTRGGGGFWNAEGMPRGNKVETQKLVPTCLQPIHGGRFSPRVASKHLAIPVVFHPAMRPSDTTKAIHLHVIRRPPADIDGVDERLRNERLQIIGWVFLLQRLGVRPHDESCCQIVERPCPNRSATPVPLGRIKPAEEDDVPQDIDQTEEPATARQRLLGPKAAAPSNAVWSTYMFKANMASVACVLFGTGPSGELARPMAMWYTGGIQSPKMMSSSVKV